MGAKSDPQFDIESHYHGRLNTWSTFPMVVTQHTTRGCDSSMEDIT